jgi:hypothetical protein
MDRACAPSGLSQSSLSQAEPLVPLRECPHCDGRGGFPVGGTQCCGGSDWECGASGCTGPIEEWTLEMCPACGGHGKVEE